MWFILLSFSILKEIDFFFFGLKIIKCDDSICCLILVYLVGFLMVLKYVYEIVMFIVNSVVKECDS